MENDVSTIVSASCVQIRGCVFNMQQDESRHHSTAEKTHGARERHKEARRLASPLVLPRTGKIDGCIQDFYTPLIGFTGH